MDNRDIPILIDDSIVTAMFGYPFAAGWLDSTGVALVERLTARRVREERALALVDSIAAWTLLDTHVVVRDVAVAARRASFVVLATPARPDTVDRVMISHAGVSPAGLAVAQVTIPAFYGISVTGWTDEPRQVSHEVALVMEGARALDALDPVDPESAEEPSLSIEGVFQEDIGRAWHLLTNTPFVSHVGVAPRDTLTANPAALVAAVDRLVEARSLAKARGRELRRDLSHLYAIEREVLTETLADQTHELGDDELAGLVELWTRSGLAPKGVSLRSSLVRLRRA